MTSALPNSTMMAITSGTPNHRPWVVFIWALMSQGSTGSFRDLGLGTAPTLQWPTKNVTRGCDRHVPRLTELTAPFRRHLLDNEPLVSSIDTHPHFLASLERKSAVPSQFLAYPDVGLGFLWLVDAARGLKNHGCKGNQ